MQRILQLRLLGGFQADYGGEPLATIDSPRLQSLVAYLTLCADAPQLRRQISFHFWPDSTEPQARTNLRQLLHLLRRALPEPERFLRVERRTLQWRPDAPSVVDVAELDAAWAAADEALSAGDVRAATAASERAAALYAGELLPSCYEAWIEPERERLRTRTEAGLGRLVELLESRRQYDAAVRYARTLLRLDPLRERTHQALIRLHMLSGESALAVRAFDECAELLRRELDAQPGPETRALLERVPAGRAPHAGTGPAGRADPDPPLVGRHDEWQTLRALWQRTRSDGARLALVEGEPGIGKTRLCEALVDWAGRQGVVTAHARSFAAEGQLAYGPVAQWLRTDTFRRGFDGLDDVWLSELSRVLPELAAERPDLEPPDGVPEGWRRSRLFEALARAVLHPGEPRLLLLDDLQWCDGETLEWLHFLLRFEPRAPLLVLATMRTGEAPTSVRLHPFLLHMRGSDTFTELPLGPLARNETAELAAAVAGRELDAPDAAVLHAQTEGNPLFVVETMRAGPTAGPGDLAQCGAGAAGSSKMAAIPAKVHAVIRARLAQLSPAAAEVAALAATIGRDFGLPVLRHAVRSEDDLVAALDELLQRRLVRDQGGQTYDFSHDKIREAAYAELSSARRALLHRRVAKAFEAAYAASSDPANGEIARHLERADHHAEAIPYYRLAAERALTVHAYEEAAAYLRRARHLLDRQPDTLQRAEQELELQAALGVALVATDHYSGPRVWETYTRARALCDRIGRPASPPVLRGLALASLMRSRLPETLDLGRQLLSAAERNRDPMLEVEAHYVLGVSQYWHGRIPAAQRHLERALERYDPDRARGHLNLYSQDPSIICGIRLALALWHTGHIARARELCRETLARAEALGHPFTLAYARHYAVWILIETGDLAETRRQLVAMLRETAEYGLAVWPTMAGTMEGWLRVEDGDHDGGIERMRRAAAEYRAQELDLGFPHQKGLYARACRRAGRLTDALAAIEEGLAMADRTGERFWDAELHRLAGELLLDTGVGEEAAAERFDQALRIARQQGARTLEQRAAAALAGIGREVHAASGAGTLVRSQH